MKTSPINLFIANQKIAENKKNIDQKVKIWLLKNAGPPKKGISATETIYSPRFSDSP